MWVGGGLAGGPDSAVYGDDGAGDVGGAAAAEEDGDAGHVVGASNPRQRGAGGVWAAERGERGGAGLAAGVWGGAGLAAGQVPAATGEIAAVVVGGAGLLREAAMPGMAAGGPMRRSGAEAAISSPRVSSV